MIRELRMSCNMDESAFCHLLCQAASRLKFKVVREGSRFAFMDPFGPIVIGNQSEANSEQANLYLACLALQTHLRV